MVLADCFTSGGIQFSRRAFYEKPETLAHSNQFLKFYFFFSWQYLRWKVSSTPNKRLRRAILNFTNRLPDKSSPSTDYRISIQMTREADSIDIWLLFQHINYPLGFSHLQLLPHRCHLIIYLFQHFLPILNNWTTFFLRGIPASADAFTLPNKPNQSVSISATSWECI